VKRIVLIIILYQSSPPHFRDKIKLKKKIMEKAIIIQCEKSKPLRDFIKDEWEVVESKTEAGIEYYVLRERLEPLQSQGS
jgi:hypothetical protein